MADGAAFTYERRHVLFSARRVTPCENPQGLTGRKSRGPTLTWGLSTVRRQRTAMAAARMRPMPLLTLPEGAPRCAVSARPRAVAVPPATRTDTRARPSLRAAGCLRVRLGGPLRLRQSLRRPARASVRGAGNQPQARGTIQARENKDNARSQLVTPNHLMSRLRPRAPRARASSRYMLATCRGINCLERP